MRIKDNAHNWVWLEEIPDEFGYCERCHFCVNIYDVDWGDLHIRKGAKKYTYEQAVEIKKLKDKENDNTRTD